jgi:Family of unknown function (DUF6522)
MESTSPSARVEFGKDTVFVDATLIADGLGVDPTSVPSRMRDGEITAVCERGMDDDAGLYRMTFFRAGYRVRLIVDSEGTLQQRTSVNFGNRGSYSQPKRQRP